jgi:hypothetical protein
LHNGQLVLFDSSLPGMAIDAFLTIKIPGGSYVIETLHYSPTEELSLILHRLVPRSDTDEA